MRWCPVCNRPKTSDFHDVVEIPVPGGGSTPLRPGHPNRWKCRLRLIATSPVTGKTLSPNSPQRITELDTRFVYEGRLKNA